MAGPAPVMVDLHLVNLGVWYQRQDHISIRFPPLFRMKAKQIVIAPDKKPARDLWWEHNSVEIPSPRVLQQSQRNVGPVEL